METPRIRGFPNGGAHDVGTVTLPGLWFRPPRSWTRIMTRFARSQILLIAGAGVWVLAAMISTGGKAQDSETPKPGLVPVAGKDDTPELALLMGDLQRLTHKMALSANEGNAELAAFYMHESLEQLTAIQEQAPVYEDQPVALLIERMALPSYEKFREAVKARPADRERMLTALDGVIASCNQCHVASKHPLIRITRGTEVNPFNQSFKPPVP
jgi:hypothetical protein